MKRIHVCKEEECHALSEGAKTDLSSKKIIFLQYAFVFYISIPYQPFEFLRYEIFSSISVFERKLHLFSAKHMEPHSLNTRLLFALFLLTFANTNAKSSGHTSPHTKKSTHDSQVGKDLVRISSSSVRKSSFELFNVHNRLEEVNKQMKVTKIMYVHLYIKFNIYFFSALTIVGASVFIHRRKAQQVI